MIDNMDNLIQKFELFNGYVLTASIKESAGKFELPESSDRKVQKGQVIKISEQPDKSDMGMEWSCPVKIGQIIYYRNWGSEIYDLGGADYVAVRFRDIIMAEIK